MRHRLPLYNGAGSALSLRTGGRARKQAGVHWSPEQVVLDDEWPPWRVLYMMGQAEGSCLHSWVGVGTKEITSLG